MLVYNLLYIPLKLVWHICKPLCVLGGGGAVSKRNKVKLMWNDSLWRQTMKLLNSLL